VRSAGEPSGAAGGGEDRVVRGRPGRRARGFSPLGGLGGTSVRRLRTDRSALLPRMTSPFPPALGGVGCDGTVVRLPSRPGQLDGLVMGVETHDVDHRAAADGEDLPAQCRASAFPGVPGPLQNHLDQDPVSEDRGGDGRRPGRAARPRAGRRRGRQLDARLDDHCHTRRRRREGSVRPGSARCPVHLPVVGHRRPRSRADPFPAGQAVARRRSPGVLDAAVEDGLLVGRLGLTDAKGTPLCAGGRIGCRPSTVSTPCGWEPMSSGLPDSRNR
jgi:hypothetical protein